MYTVEIKDTNKNESTRLLEVIIVIKNNDEKALEKLLTFPLYTTNEQIQRVIKEYVEELEAGDVLKASVEIGPIDLKNVTSEVPPEKLLEVAFLRDLAIRERIQKLIEWGIVSANHPKVTAVNSRIQTTLAAHPNFIDKV